MSKVVKPDLNLAVVVELDVEPVDFDAALARFLLNFVRSTICGGDPIDGKQCKNINVDTRKRLAEICDRGSA